MRRVLTTFQMQELDRWAVEDIGIPAICLMENAGRLVADEVIKSLKDAPGPVCIVCGIGNNGGDGLVVARYLFNKGISVSVFLVGDRSRLSDEALVNYMAVGNLKIPILVYGLKGIASLKRAALIVDALFGIGISREVKGKHRDIIEIINALPALVVSVDIPSGLDATTGKVWGAAVRADMTVSLAHPKRGFYTGDGPQYAGRIKVVDIGIPGGYAIQ